MASIAMFNYQTTRAFRTFSIFLLFCSVCVDACAIVFNQWLKTVPTRAASIWRFTARVGASPVQVPQVSRCGMVIILYYIIYNTFNFG